MGPSWIRSSKTTVFKRHGSFDIVTSHFSLLSWDLDVKSLQTRISPFRSSGQHMVPVLIGFNPELTLQPCFISYTFHDRPFKFRTFRLTLQQQRAAKIMVMTQAEGGHTKTFSELSFFFLFFLVLAWFMILPCQNWQHTGKKKLASLFQKKAPSLMWVEGGRWWWDLACKYALVMAQTKCGII